MYRRISPDWQKSKSYFRALADLDAARLALYSAKRGEDQLVARVRLEVAKLRLQELARALSETL